MKPEEQARQNIDQLLTKAGWIIQDANEINLGAGLGIAVREYPTKTGPVDYALFVDRKAIGVIEAKAVGTPLGGVAEQSGRYIHGFPDNVQHFTLPLPFAYESTGVETFFRDERDPAPRSRRVFAFHKPEILLEWVKQDETLRGRLQELPPLITSGLRDCQIEAVNNLDISFKDARPRALIQMATGSGKTFTAVTMRTRFIDDVLIDRSPEAVIFLHICKIAIFVFFSIYM
jgi:type I restriction enzyme R subunit